MSNSWRSTAKSISWNSARWLLPALLIKTSSCSKQDASFRNMDKQWIFMDRVKEEEWLYVPCPDVAAPNRERTSAGWCQKCRTGPEECPSRSFFWTRTNISLWPFANFARLCRTRQACKRHLRPTDTPNVRQFRSTLRLSKSLYPAAVLIRVERFDMVMHSVGRKSKEKQTMNDTLTQRATKFVVKTKSQIAIECTKKSIK